MWGLGNDLASDFRRHRPGITPSILGALDLATSHPGFLACALLRLMHHFHQRGHRRVAYKVRALNHALTGADFVPGCKIGAGLLAHHPNGIVIGGGVQVGTNCTILQHVTLGEKQADGRGAPQYPRLGDDVVVGAGAAILGPVTLGDGSVVGANAVVLSDAPQGSTVVGNPARIVPRREAPAGKVELAKQ